MRSSVLASLTISALFCLVTAPAWAQEAPTNVPPSNTAQAAPPATGVPAIHAPQAATASVTTDAGPTKRRWYGYQTLGADAASLALITAGVSSRNGLLALPGAVGLFVGPSLIHASHGNWRATGLSLAMRLAGIPLAGVVGNTVGEAKCSPASQDRDVPCSAVLANLSMLGVAVAAIVVDGAVLSYDSVPDDQYVGHPRRDSAALRVVPSVSWSRERSLVTLSGDF